MDWTAIAEVGCFIFGAIGTIFTTLYFRNQAKTDEEMKKHGETIDGLSKELANHKLYAAENYVTSRELDRTVGDIKQTLERMTNSIEKLGSEMRDIFLHIQAKLDSKADK